MDDSACLTREIYIFSAYMEWVFWVGKYLFLKFPILMRLLVTAFSSLSRAFKIRYKCSLIVFNLISVYSAQHTACIYGD